MNASIKSDIPGLIRKMNNFERTFYMSPNLKPMISVRLKGNVSVKRFQEAIKRLQQMHPFLRSKVIFDCQNEAWFSDHQVLPPRLKIVNRTSDSQWYEIIQSEIKETFDPEKRPMVNFVLLHPNTISDLLVLASQV